MIPIGDVPNPQIVIQRAGSPTGARLPVVGTLYGLIGKPAHYAGAGTLSGDVVRFDADSWRPRPAFSYAEAAAHAVEHADRLAWHDDVRRRLPEELP